MFNLDKKIAVLLPYDELIEFSQQIADKLKIKIITKKISSENAIKTAQECCNSGVEIIISRGNLAVKIQEKVDIEVISVNFTGYDFLDALYKYKDFKQPIGIIENKYIIAGCKEVNRHLNLDLHYYQVANVENFSEKTMEAINDGMQLLIGGSWGIEIRKFLENYNIQYEMIRSRKLSIESTINTAVAILTKKSQKDHNIEILNTIAECRELGVIVVNSQNRITSINTMAKSMLHINATSIIGEKSSVLIPELNLASILEGRKKVFDKKIFLHNKNYLLNAIPIFQDEEINSTVVFIKFEKEQNNNINLNSISKMNATANSDEFFDFIVNDSEYYRTTRNLASCYAKADYNVLITGEFGTGKKALAKYIHKHSQRNQNPFIIVDCASDIDALENIFPSKIINTSDYEKSLIEYSNHGILFLENIDKLSFNMQTRIIEFLKSEFMQSQKNNISNRFDIRFIASTEQNLYELVQKGTFHKKLFYFLNIYSLKTIPVNSSKEFMMHIIKSAIDYEINLQQLNITVDKEIVGKLVEFQWNGNIIEIQNCIKKICILINECIPVEDIINEISPQCVAKLDNNFPANNISLQDMEQKAINDAIIRNDGNKTKASAELGIDRTTLNRKLKTYGLN